MDEHQSSGLVVGDAAPALAGEPIVEAPALTVGTEWTAQAVN